MISVEEAKELITTSVNRLTPVDQQISDCLFHVLAKNVISSIEYPPYNHSTMDGFAFIISDLLEGKEIEVIGEAPAGKPFSDKIKSGQAVRVFTGSEIPEGSDTVVMQEKATEVNGKLIILDEFILFGANVHQKGSQIKAGDIVLKCGTLLSPAAIGLLAGLGFGRINVYPNPRVSVIVTGNELQAPGMSLSEGQVYESNSYALRAALQSLNIQQVDIHLIGDEEALTKETIGKAVLNSDVVLVSGGISVGRYDYVNTVMQQIGVERIFYKIFQKPGKPLFFGYYNNCFVFGLPGNPASALTCFYEYAYPVLRIMQGFSDTFLKRVYLPVSSDFNKNADFSFFLKGRILEGKVEILSGQESNNISGPAYANCLIYLPAATTRVKSGELVEVHLLPGNDFPY